MLKDSAALAATFPSELTGGQASPTESEIRQSLAEWIFAVNSGHAESVNTLYAPNAKLLPTFDARVLTTPDERLVYFINFKTRRGLHAVVNECRVDILGPESAMANGLYTFRFLGDNGAEQTVNARFTFVYTRQQEGDWLIAAHHSSATPA